MGKQKIPAHSEASGMSEVAGKDRVEMLGGHTKKDASKEERRRMKRLRKKQVRKKGALPRHNGQVNGGHGTGKNVNGGGAEIAMGSGLAHGKQLHSVEDDEEELGSDFILPPSSQPRPQSSSSANISSHQDAASFASDSDYNLPELFSEFEDQQLLQELIESGAAPIEEVGLLLSACDGSIEDYEAASKVFDRAGEKRMQLDKFVRGVKVGIVAHLWMDEEKKQAVLRGVYEFAREVGMGEREAEMEVMRFDAAVKKEFNGKVTLELDQGASGEVVGGDDDECEGWDNNADDDDSFDGGGEKEPTSEGYSDWVHSEYKKYESTTAKSSPPLGVPQVSATVGKKRKRSSLDETTIVIPSFSVTEENASASGRAADGSDAINESLDAKEEVKKQRSHQRREARRAKRKTVKALKRQVQETLALLSVAFPTLTTQLPDLGGTVKAIVETITPETAAPVPATNALEQSMSANLKRWRTRTKRGPVTSSYFIDTSITAPPKTAAEPSERKQQLAAKSTEDTRNQEVLPPFPAPEPKTPADEANSIDGLNSALRGKRRRTKRAQEAPSSEAWTNPRQVAALGVAENGFARAAHNQEVSVINQLTTRKGMNGGAMLGIHRSPDLQSLDEGSGKSKKRKRKRNQNQLVENPNNATAHAQSEHIGNESHLKENEEDPALGKRIRIKEPSEADNLAYQNGVLGDAMSMLPPGKDQGVESSSAKKNPRKRKERRKCEPVSSAVDASAVPNKSRNDATSDLKLEGLKEVFERISKQLSPNANIERSASQPLNERADTNEKTQKPRAVKSKRAHVRKNKVPTIVGDEHPKDIHSPSCQSYKTKRSVEDLNGDIRDEGKWANSDGEAALPQQTVDVIIHSSAMKRAPGDKQDNVQLGFKGQGNSSLAALHRRELENSGGDAFEERQINPSRRRSNSSAVKEPQSQERKTRIRDRIRESPLMRRTGSSGKLYVRDSTGKFARSASLPGEGSGCSERSQVSMERRPSTSGGEKTSQPRGSNAPDFKQNDTPFTPPPQIRSTRGQSTRSKMVKSLQSAWATNDNCGPIQKHDAQPMPNLGDVHYPSIAARALAAPLDAGTFSGVTNTLHCGYEFKERNPTAHEVRVPRRRSSSARNSNSSFRAPPACRDASSKISRAKNTKPCRARSAGKSPTVDDKDYTDGSEMSSKDDITSSRRRSSSARASIRSSQTTPKLRDSQGRFAKKSPTVEGAEDTKLDFKEIGQDADCKGLETSAREGPFIPPPSQHSADCSPSPAVFDPTPSNAPEVKKKKQPLKSPFFAPILPGSKPRKGNLAKSSVEVAATDIYPSKLQTPKKENLSPSKTTPKRSPGGIISCIPFPPLSAPHFGLIQEKLAHDPFRLLIAVTFLIRTHGKHAIPVFFELMQKYPTPELLAAANVKDILPIIRHLGLQNQRAVTYQTYARTWLKNPPTKGERYPVRGYPEKDSAKDVKKDEILSDNDERDAWEIAHMVQGRYALDSWRIFCRDELRGLARDWNGEGSDQKGFQPEWMRVLPEDKELRAYLRWMWLKEGFEWDPYTGEKEVAGERLLRAAMEGRIAWDERGGMRILDDFVGDSDVLQVAD